MTDLTECTPTALEDVLTAEDMATPAAHATATSTAASSSPGDAAPSSLHQEPAPGTPGPGEMSATLASLSSFQRCYPTQLRVPTDRYRY